jgi:regulator of sigma E protease
VIGRVIAGSAAARAGLQVGDRIMAVANQPITDWQQLVQVIEPRAQQVTRLEVRRGTGQVTLTVVPQAVSLPSGKTVGRMGITPQISDTLRQQWTVMQSDPPLRALRHGFRQSWKLGQLSLVSLIHLVSGRGSWDDVGGPVRIASMAGESARLGLIPYLEFIAVVSLSLGILNLMPIPVLDGGHLLYHALEFVRGRPLSDAMMARTQQWGLLLLLGMMGFSFYNDLRQFFNQ